MLEHGGRLLAAAKQYGRPAGEWLDLSTGISPWPYPVPPLPPAVWQRLPEEDDGLDDAARACYGATHVLMLPGSQAAIQALPNFFPAGRVAMPAPLYAEHPACWRAAGHAVVAWNTPADYAVLCNPNNPTGQRFTREELLALAGTVRLLVVDEAFIDAAPEQSLATHVAENIIVLRSLGKFFGLAGARVGCAIGAPALLQKLRDALGPWALSNPARWAARHALADTTWQAEQRVRLHSASHRLADLLQKVPPAASNESGFANAELADSRRRVVGAGDMKCPAWGTAGTALFRYLETPRAVAIHAALARRGVLVRRFGNAGDPPALRFGLPGDEGQWQRLTDTLKEIS